MAEWYFDSFKAVISMYCYINELILLNPNESAFYRSIRLFGRFKFFNDAICLTTVGGSKKAYYHGPNA